MNTQTRWRRVVHGLLITGMLFLMATGLALYGTPEGAKDALVFRSPDGSVSMATVNGDDIEVKQLSDAGQEIEYISTARNARSVWVVYPKTKADVDEGWRKYGPLNVYIIRGDIKHIPQHWNDAVALSPNGDQLVYIVSTDAGSKHILCCMNLRTGKTETITQELSLIQTPSWSPDGTKLAYFGSQDIEGYRLHVIDMSSKKDVERSQPTLAMNFSGNIMSKPIWSPDSRLIYFTSKYDEVGAYGGISTYEVSAIDSAPPRKIAPGRCNSISPDGKIVNVSGKGYRTDTAEVTPAELPESMSGSSVPSFSGKVTAHKGGTGKPITVWDDGLWCKIHETGKEVKVSDARWDGSNHNWQQQWVVLDPSRPDDFGPWPPQTTGTIPVMPPMPGMPGTPPPPPAFFPTGPLCDKLVLLAAEMDRSGRKIDSLTPVEKSGLPKGWQKGLPLAMGFIRKGVSEVIPFAVWVMNIEMDPSTSHFSQRINIEETRMACLGLEQTIGKSRAGVLRLAAILTAPESADISDIQMLRDGIQAVTEEDREVLFTLFSKRKISTKTLYFAIISTLEVPWAQPWLRDLAETQNESSYGVMITLGRSIETGDPAQVRKQLKRLAATNDWEYTSYYVDAYAPQLIQKGMRKEAIQLLEIISDKGVSYPKTNAGIELGKLTGKPPKQPTGADANDPYKWLENTRVNKGLNRIDDAKAACLKALKAAKNPREKVDVYKVIAEIDPMKAFDLTAGLLPEFLRGDASNDVAQLVARTAGEALYIIANARWSLASRVAPFMERVFNHDINTKYALEKERALINLWAGNIDEGVKNLSEGYNDPMRLYIAVIVRDDLNAATRVKVLQGLKDYLAAKNPEPKKVEEAIKYTNELIIDTDKRMKTGKWMSSYGDKLSPEGMRSLAATLWRYVSTSPDPTPEVLKLHALAGLPFPESLTKAGKSPEGDIKPYPEAVRKGDPVKGSDPSGVYTIRTYTAPADVRKVYDYFRGFPVISGGSSIQDGKASYADFTMMPTGYRVLVHIESKGATQTEFTIKVYGEQ